MRARVCVRVCERVEVEGVSGSEVNIARVYITGRKVEASIRAVKTNCTVVLQPAICHHVQLHQGGWARTLKKQGVKQKKHFLRSFCTLEITGNYLWLCFQEKEKKQLQHAYQCWQCDTAV